MSLLIFVVCKGPILGSCLPFPKYDLTVNY